MTSPWPCYTDQLPLSWRRPECAHVHPEELTILARRRGLRPADVEGPIFGIVIGAMPGANPTVMPLHPGADSSAGARLMTWSGMPVGQWIGRLRRINLYDRAIEPWHHEGALERAAAIRKMLAADLEARRASTSDAGPLNVLLLGVRVSTAFGIKLPMQSVELDGHCYRSIPHPGIKSKIYDDDKHRMAAGIAARATAGFRVGKAL